LLRRKGWGSELRALRFFLPHGFWQHTLSLQQGSVLVLNFGGLGVRAKYVALVQFAETVRGGSTYFFDESPGSEHEKRLRFER
jgi:hypothetical protein